MATKAAGSHQTSATDEKVETKLNEEVKAIEQESASPSMETGAGEVSKAETSPGPIELAEKMEDKQIEPHVVEDIKKTDETLVPDVPIGDSLKVVKHYIPLSDTRSVPDSVGEVPKAEASLSPIESVEKVEDKQIEPPVVEDVKKTHESPVLNVPIGDCLKVEKDYTTDSNTPTVPDPVVEAPKAEASPNSTESTAKMEDKQIEPPVDVKKTDETLVPDVPIGDCLKVEKGYIPDSVTTSVPDPVVEAPKAEASPSSTESAEKVEDKQIEPPVVEDVKKTDETLVPDVPIGDCLKVEKDYVPDSVTTSVPDLVGEVPKAEASPSPTESAEKVEDKQIEPPVVEDVKKTNETPAPDVPIADSLKVEKYYIPDLDIKGVPDLVGEVPKAETSPSPTEFAEKVEDKQIEPPIVQDVKKTDEAPVLDVPIGDSLKVEKDYIPKSDTISVAAPIGEVPEAEASPNSTESVENVEDKQIEPPVVEDVKKFPDVPIGDCLKVENDSIPNSDTLSVPDLVADAAKSQPKEQPEIKSIEKESQEQPVMESIEKLSEEQRQIVDVPESSAKTIEKEVQLEVLPVKEVEAVVKVIEDSDVGSLKVGEPDAAVTEIKEKTTEQSDPTEEVAKTRDIEPKESVEGHTLKDDDILADKIEDTTILSKVQTCKDEEPNFVNTLEQAVSSNQGAQIDQNADDGDSSLPGIVEKVGAKDEKYSSGVDVAEMLLKEAVVVETAGKENEAKPATNDADNNKNYVINEEPTQPTKVEYVKSSTSTAEVTENSLEGEKTSGDVELAVENKKDTKDEKPVLVETNKDENSKGKLEEEVTTGAKELVKEYEESKLSAGEDAVETGGDKLEKENVDEIAKSDVQNLESSTKDGDGTITSKDLPEEVPAKPAQKHSNNIISKVKQSLVKAKKAIIGKSPGSKTVAADTKGDSKVK